MKVFTVSFTASICIFIYLILSPLNSFSQEIEPRNYSSIPVGLNVIALSYAYSSGDVVAEASSPLQDLQLTSNIIGLGFLRSLGVLGKLCKIQAAVPYVFLGGNVKFKGRDTTGSRSGFADARIKLLMNIIGTPALQPKEFVTFKEDFVLGASMVISAPLGQYYPEKLINLGSNRWGFKPEIGASYNKGPFFFELFTGVWFFTKNSEFIKTNTLQQDPVYSLQGHVSYLFPSKIWVALDGVYVTGGKTEVNDVYRNDFQKNLRGGATLSVPINIHNSIKANFSSGVATRAGGNFTTFSLTYQYLWF